MLDLSRDRALAKAVTDTNRQATALLKFLNIRADDILADRWPIVTAAVNHRSKKANLHAMRSFPS